MSRRSIWTDPAPYGTYEGPPGDEREWQRAFEERFSPGQIRKILGTRSAWEVLGIPAGSSAADVKAAYRKRARATHPDLNPGIDRAEFQAVQAAYQQLTQRDGR